MKKTFQETVLLMVLNQLAVAGATMFFYVAPPPSGSDTQPGSESQPFATIQKGIDAAHEGDTVIVNRGTYFETVRFKGKNIVLRSTDPLDTNGVSQTIIHGNGAQVAVQFAGTESAACQLEGLTITRGSLIGSTALGAGINGGTVDQRTRATIRHNRIVDNQETGLAGCDGVIEGNLIGNNASWKSAGGLAYCDGVIRGNRIWENQTFQKAAAGGLAWCHGLIESNTLSGNVSQSAEASGGGLAYCHGTIRGNAIANNVGSSDGGGGLYHCDGAIEGNWITENAALHGGGLAYCLALVQGNIIAHNRASGIYRCHTALRNNGVFGNQACGIEQCNGPIQNNSIYGNTGVGLSGCYGPILNCIVWGNANAAPLQLVASSVPAYSCIQHWPGEGAGNFALDPHFREAATGDFHLQSWSPAIDAGDPASDASQEPEASRPRIDVGAYGNTAEAGSRSPDTDGDQLPDLWESQWFGNLAQSATNDVDGDGIINLTEYRYGWNPLTPAATRVQNATQGKWYETIQTALGESVMDDQIVVEPGVHRENVHFQGRNVALRSTHPADPEVVARTIIEGHPRGAVITFTGTEDEEYCRLEGLTLRHGDDVECCQEAWGICGGTADRHTRVHIHNNIITGNWAERGAGMIYCDGILYGNIITNNHAWAGGGLAYCNGVIESNLIAHNQASLGGGLANCQAFIYRNTIADNLGYSGGGGLLGCSGMIQENLIQGNWTEQDESAGGGLKDCAAAIAYNIITDNRSRCDGGGALAGCPNNIVGNLMARNTTDGEGGGLINCSGLIQNNTIADNRAYAGGGLAYCRGNLQNCIVWGNSPENEPQLVECNLPTYSCLQNWTGGGEGNLAYNPGFVSPATGNYRLRSTSPCLDTGTPGEYYLPERDLAGHCRVLYGGHRFCVDMGAYEYAIARCEVALDRQSVTLTWSSRLDKYYYLSYSANLQTWTQTARVRSAGNATSSWIDNGSLTGGSMESAPALFYRIYESDR